MSEVRPQLLITLVHGTWPRGFCPKLFLLKQRVRELMRLRQPGEPPPFWFEGGSPFLARLSAELRDIPQKITPLLWTGENSISEREKTAHLLAEHLSAELAEHPQDTQLIIAHSHGGNIALHALYHLHQPDGSRLREADSATPLVVTLGTPFIEVQHADFGNKPRFIRIAVLSAVWLLYWNLTGAFFPERLTTPSSALAHIAFAVVVLLVLFFSGSYWGADLKNHNRVEALRAATRLGDIVLAQAQRLLIIRAIDDEASLGLALGTIVNYVTTRAITYAYWLFFFVFFLGPLFLQKHFFDAIKVRWSALVLILLGLLSLARALHGRELAVSPMGLQINTQSAPDAEGSSKIVTLVRRTYTKSLRHGIYDHEDCAKTISDWVRSQLSTLPAR